MKKAFWILAPLILIIGVVILIIALTDNSPDNPFKEYRLIIGLGLLCVAGFTGITCKKLYKWDFVSSWHFWTHCLIENSNLIIRQNERKRHIN